MFVQARQFDRQGGTAPGRVGFASYQPARLPVLLTRAYPEDRASVTKRLQRISGHCAYCNQRAPQPPRGQEPLWRPSFEHLQPQSAGGPKDLANGLLACPPCNSARKNTPFIEFLHGVRADYGFKPGDGGVQATVLAQHPAAPPDQQAHIRRSVSLSLQRFLRARARLDVQSPANSWFFQALDRMVFPAGLAPPGTGHGGYGVRVQALLGQLSQAHPRFWLGPAFRQVVATDGAQAPEAQAALQAAIDSLKAARRKRKPSSA